MPLRLASLALALALLAPRFAVAQDLEPRAYSASPVGTTFLVVGAGRSTGDVIFDASLPFSDVRADVGGVTVGLGRTLPLFGRLVLVSGALPYTWGTIDGKVAEQDRRISRAGLADMRVRIAVNLRGAPALSPREFATRKRGTVIGTSLTVQAPLGQYRPDKLINLGTNRWAIKPEIGVSRPLGRWDLESYAGVWLFTENPTFYPGQAVRTQDPIGVVQAHASYTIRPRAWAAVNATWYGGGAASVDDGPPTGRQNNSRIGATLSWPIGRRQSIKASYAVGAFVRTGASFRSVAVTWQMLWLDGGRGPAK